MNRNRQRTERLERRVDQLVLYIEHLREHLEAVSRHTPEPYRALTLAEFADRDKGEAGHPKHGEPRE